MKHKPFRGLSAILFKEFIIVARDPLTLFFFFFPPLIEMIAFAASLRLALNLKSSIVEEIDPNLALA